MKSARCEICGLVLYANTPPVIILHRQQPSVAEAQGMADVAEFDLLAGDMAVHLGSKHPDHTAEMAAIGFLASKVYAMTWAESTTGNFRALRKAWRTAVLTELAKERNQPAAGAEADGSSASADAPPSGSNEKKSVRNVSN